MGAVSTDRGEREGERSSGILSCRLQRCVKELSRWLERCSGRVGLEKAQLHQIDRLFSDLGRILAGKVSVTHPHTLTISQSPSLTLSHPRYRTTSLTGHR